ncbi:hypothetical protein ASPSYDRAFT_48532 [Aspergillus sydowii CBS 593.65]|uniref:Secreted protein n=1 Tax=Aspergillus sydowii CBS 593.65 TaxID=1036612 RepID=A0A1L9TA15_9EURO|nr:uncharacterized protein ASPSYDRAFT_48532 [Aspergillus sydowii CBS 593.65]OJJ56254.1 hypothetical protein ASPSYDRAFT_48532 [Aspergillus sydowii CBS 593.65]
MQLLGQALFQLLVSSAVLYSYPNISPHYLPPITRRRQPAHFWLISWRLICQSKWGSCCRESLEYLTVLSPYSCSIAPTN